MTDFCKTEKFKADHSTFGGIIYQSDFETDYRGKNNTHGSSVAQRIQYDQHFDEQCKKNIGNRENSRTTMKQHIN